jgi:hypothetical protein
MWLSFGAFGASPSLCWSARVGSEIERETKASPFLCAPHAVSMLSHERFPCVEAFLSGRRGA